MKHIALLMLVALFGATAFAQSVGPVYDVFTPKTLYAGTSMSARTASTTLDDTTRALVVRGYAAVYVGFETAANDSAALYLSYRTSKDGTNFNAAGFTSIDSLKFTSGTGTLKYMALPTAALGAYAVQFRVQGQAWGAYSSNPSTTVTTKVVRVPYNQTKAK